MSKITKQMGVDGDVLDGFINLNPNEVFIPEGRFRPINKKTVQALVESITKHGQLQPIIVDTNGNLIAGNHRVQACIELGIMVEAKVTSELDPDKLALQEIDENLVRAELTQTQLENHLAQRKELYNKLYPDTAKRGAKGTENSGKDSFTDDTSKVTGMSASVVDRTVRRGELASQELQEARDAKLITSGDVDKVIAEVGGDITSQSEKLKAMIKEKAEKKEAKVKGEPVEVDEEDTKAQLKELGKELKESNKALEKSDNAHEKELAKLQKVIVKHEATIEALQGRIVKAQTDNPELKI